MTIYSPLRAAIGTLCLLVGLLGNLLVLLSVWRHRPLRRTVNMLVASLAVCDLAQTLAVRPLHIQAYAAGRWRLGTQTCVYALVISDLLILEDMLQGFGRHSKRSSTFLQTSGLSFNSRSKKTWHAQGILNCQLRPCTVTTEMRYSLQM